MIFGRGWTICPIHMETNMSLMEMWAWLTTIVTIASVVSAMTPTKKDDEFLHKYVTPFIDALALNVFNAKPEKK
jgi:hypothetical protein